MSNASDFIIENGVLIKYVGPGGDVVVPENVIAIGFGAFKDSVNIVSVHLPDSIDIILSQAFWGCVNMTNIHLPKSMKLIESSAFCMCLKLKELELPAGITELKESMFRRCESLERIVIPSGVNKLYSGVFSGCSNLKEIKLPVSLESMGYGNAKPLDTRYGPFAFCENIRYIVAPAIKPSDFSDKQLKYAAILGYLHEKDAFTNPDVAEAYERYILSQRKTSLKIILENDLAEWITVMDKCGKITEANFEAEYFTPATEANAERCIEYLRGCEKSPAKQKKKKISRSDESKTAEKCTVVTAEQLWKSKKYPGGGIELTKYMGKDTDIFIPERIGSKPVCCLGKELFSTMKTGKAADNLKILNKIHSVHIPDSVISIGDEAFKFSQKLSSIYLSNNLIEIGGNAFLNCIALQEIYIPSSVQKIGTNAFALCYNLTIHAPAGSYAEQYAKENNIPFVAE